MSVEPNPRLPLTREHLDKHIAYAIWERCNIAYDITQHEDGGTEVCLREGGEQSIWRVVQEAIKEAGWTVVCGQ